LNVHIHQGNQVSNDTSLTLIAFQKLTTNFDIMKSSGDSAKKDREERKRKRKRKRE
jgi:hypothetical protein